MDKKAYVEASTEYYSTLQFSFLLLLILCFFSFLFFFLGGGGGGGGEREWLKMVQKHLKASLDIPSKLYTVIQELPFWYAERAYK
jgi:hypothetical protein